MAGEGGGKVLRSLDLLTLEADDEVSSEHDGLVALVGALGSPLKAGAFGGSAGQDALDEDTVVGGEADLLGDVRTNGEDGDVEGWPADAAVAVMNCSETTVNRSSRCRPSISRSWSGQTTTGFEL